MLIIKYGPGGTPVSDFEAQEWVDFNVDFYMDIPAVCKDKDGNPTRGNKVIRTSNELVLLMFGLKVQEGVLPLEEVEFYVENERVEFDPVLGLQNPKGRTIGFYSDVIERALRLSRKNTKKGVSTDE